MAVGRRTRPHHGHNTQLRGHYRCWPWPPAAQSLLASLVVVSSLFYLALANWLPLLRRIITPAVSGTALMLIAITVLPVAFDRVQEMPSTRPPRPPDR